MARKICCCAVLAMVAMLAFVALAQEPAAVPKAKKKRLITADGKAPIKLLAPEPIPVEIKPVPPKQPSLAQPAPPPASIVQPTSPGATLVRPSTQPDALARPSDASAALAPNAVAPVSLAQARPLEASGTATRPTADATSLAQPPPPPLALPSVLATPAAPAGGAAIAPVVPAPVPGAAAAPAAPARAARRQGAAPKHVFDFTQEHVATNGYDPIPYATWVTISKRNRTPMQPVSLMIVCDGDVRRGAVQADEDVEIEGLRDGRVNLDKKVYWLVYESPAFDSEKPLTVVLMSDHPLNVLSVKEGPTVR